MEFMMNRFFLREITVLRFVILFNFIFRYLVIICLFKKLNSSKQNCFFISYNI